MLPGSDTLPAPDVKRDLHSAAGRVSHGPPGSLATPCLGPAAASRIGGVGAAAAAVALMAALAAGPCPAVAADVTTRTAPASTGTPTGRADTAAVVDQLDQVAAALRAHAATLDREYGYEGSKQTIDTALRAAGFSGTALQTAARFAGRLYSLQARTVPFFDTHLAAIGTTRAMLTAQGWLPAADVGYIGRQLDRLAMIADQIDEAFRQLVVLHVSTSTNVLAAERHRRDASQTAGALGRLGGTAGSDIVTAAAAAAEEAEGRVSAGYATSQWTLDWLASASARLLLEPPKAVAERARYRVAAVTFEGGPNAPPVAVPGVPASAATQPADPASAIAAQRARLAAATEQVPAAQQAFDEAVRGVEAVDLALRSVRSPKDLDEVRLLAGRLEAMAAEEQATRKEIATTSLDTEAGRLEANRMAQRLLTLRKERPAVEAELRAARSKEGLESWQRAQREELARRGAALAAARLRFADELANAAGAASALATLSAGELQRAQREELDRVAGLISAARRGPGVADVTVSGAGEPVARLTRLDDAAAEKALGVAAAAYAGAKAVSALLDRVETASVQAALAAERQRADVDPRGALVAAGWSKAVRDLGARPLMGGAVDPSLGGALRLLGPAPPQSLEALRTPPGVAPGRAPEAARLQEMVARLAAVAAERPKALAKLARPLVKAWVRRAHAGELTEAAVAELVERELIALAWRGMVSVARRADVDARDRAAAAFDMLAGVGAGRETAFATALDARGELMEAAEVVITVGLQARASGCPAVSLGPLELAQAAPGACVYRVERLPALPAASEGGLVVSVKMRPAR